MRWWQRSAFHKMTYAERYPHTWMRLEALGLANPDASMHETVVACLDYIDGAHKRIEQLEMERDLI